MRPVLTNENIKKTVRDYLKRPNKYIPIGQWDVSNVTDMSRLFDGLTRNERLAFNEPLNQWDVSNVTTMKEMFKGCYVFNQPLNE
jgi:surface protein